MEKKTGIQITGRVRIFKNEFNGKVFYSTSISNKNQEGNWEKVYVPVQFRKGMETEGDIDINDGFVGMYKDKNGLGKVKFVILDYSLPVEGTTVEEDTDLPF